MLDPVQRQQDFPALTGISYLNTAAESIPPQCVGQALQDYWNDKQRGMIGRDAHFQRLEDCRQIAAKWLSLQPQEVAFCSCSSEAYNLLASALDLSVDDEVVVTDLDFPAGATPWLRSPRPPQLGLWQARDNGVLDLQDLAALLTANTRLVQVSLVSFLSGYRIDWQQLVQTVRRLAPQAVLAVDVTQALGRVPLPVADADIVISSTHKWALGIHGGCVVGVPTASADRVTSRAGGWFHLTNAFDADRFQHASPKAGAASFAVGMPSFAAIYALNAGLRYLDAIGIDAIGRHADPLVQQVDQRLRDRGWQPMAPYDPAQPTGIVAFRHPDADALAARLADRNVQVMNHAGRIRIAVHGYNSQHDIDRLFDAAHIREGGIACF